MTTATLPADWYVLDLDTDEAEAAAAFDGMNFGPEEETPEEAARIDEALRGMSGRVYLCTVCRSNSVDAENGYDTCADCLMRV